MARTQRIVILVGLLAVMGAASAAQSQDTIKELKDPALAPPRRAPAAFVHDAHNEKAKIDDCAACHHGGENGVIDPEVSSEDQPCSECHKANMPSGRTPLMRAYHKNCIECHTAQNKGPTTCGACHK